MRSAVRTFLALCLLALGATGVLAQSNPVVGLWSSSMPLPNGQPYATFLYQFNPDGSYQEQMTVVSAGIANYYGRWQFDPQQMTLTTTIYQFTPATIPPLQQVGVPYTDAVRFAAGGGVLYVAQNGTVPLVLTRQR